MGQAFPLSFCILQTIKNWTMGRPGNEATVIVHMTYNIVIYVLGPSLFQSFNVNLERIRTGDLSKSM